MKTTGLNGQQFKQVKDALLSAFTSQEALAIMTREELDLQLNRIIADEDNLMTIVFKLVTWAESTGRVSDLIAGAHRQNNGNPDLQRLVRESHSWPMPSWTPGRRYLWGLLAAGFVCVLVLFYALTIYLLPSQPPATTSPTISPTTSSSMPTLTAKPAPATDSTSVRTLGLLLDGDLVSSPDQSSTASCYSFQPATTPEPPTAFAAKYSFSVQHDYCSYVISVPPGFDPQFHTHLSFRAKTKTEPLHLGIGKRAAAMNLSGEIEGKKYYAITTTWKSFLIPLADLPPGGNAASDAEINAVTLGFDGNKSAHDNTLFLDDFAFVAPTE